MAYGGVVTPLVASEIFFYLNLKQIQPLMSSILLKHGLQGTGKRSKISHTRSKTGKRRRILNWFAQSTGICFSYIDLDLSNLDLDLLSKQFIYHWRIQAPLSVQFLSFSCSFWQNSWQIIDLYLKLGLAPPPVWEILGPPLDILFPNFDRGNQNKIG